MKRLFRLSRRGDNARAQAHSEIEQHIELRAQEVAIIAFQPGRGTTVSGSFLSDT
jgi:hypothetical protein